MTLFQFTISRLEAFWSRQIMPAIKFKNHNVESLLELEECASSF